MVAAYCSSCGTEFEEVDRFCADCGAPRRALDRVVGEVDNVETKPTREPAGSLPLKSSGHVWLWRSLAGSFLVAAIGIGVVFQSDHASLVNQLDQKGSELGNAQLHLASAQEESLHPTLGTWNVPQTIGPNSKWSVAGVPDTFTYHLRFTSDVPVTYAFLPVDYYVSLATCNPNEFTMNDPSYSKLNGCLYKMGGPLTKNGGGDNWWGAGTTVNVDFHAAEGCAGWMVVLFPRLADQTARVTPNVSVTYHPASAPTYPCGA